MSSERCQTVGGPYVDVNGFPRPAGFRECHLVAGEQDITAAACKRNEGPIVTFALADLACVVSPADRLAQRYKGRQEQRTLELLISSPRRMFASDQRVGTSGDWCEAYAAK